MTRYLEDLVIGETRTSRPARITAEEIIEFATMYDPQFFHLDAEAAKDTIFGGLIASGLQTLAYWRKLDHEMNGDIAFICGLEYEKIKLITPWRPGDEMHLTSEVIDKRRSTSKPDRGVLTMRFEAENQNGEVLATLLSKSLVRTGPSE